MPPIGEAIGLKAADSAFQIAGGAIGSLIANAYYKRNLDYQVAAQKELFDYQNAYNAPSAQMARLQAAGLNPNLIYGSQSPAGNAGNVPSAPSGASPQGAPFNTADVSAIMVQLAEAKAQDAMSRRNIAEANWLEKQSGRYDELVDATLRKDEAEISELNSRLNLNASEVALNSARQMLTMSQKAYTDAEITLKQYEKDRITAQTLLFQRQANREEYLAMSAKAQAAIDTLEAKYYKYFYKDDGTIKELSETEFDSLKKQFQRDASSAAVEADIQGSKVAQWVHYVTGELGRIFGAASQAGSAYRGFKKR